MPEPAGRGERELPGAGAQVHHRGPGAKALGRESVQVAGRIWVTLLAVEAGHEGRVEVLGTRVPHLVDHPRLSHEPIVPHHGKPFRAPRLADLSLSAAEINALANLGEGGTLSVRQLSERTGTRASTLTGLLDRLESRGYLVREVDPADRRSFRLPLTELGQETAARALAAIADLERAALSRLDATQLAGYHAVITALQEAC